MLTESTSIAQDRAETGRRGWFALPPMPRLLQICGYAFRAKAMLGLTGSQARQAKGYRSQFYVDVWREAAAELEATVQDLGEGILEISRGHATTRVFQNETPLDDPVTMRICLNKSLVHKVLRAQQLPTPNHAEFTLKKLQAASQFLADHVPCVVKPSDGTGGGDGVTTGIETHFHLTEAAVRAGGFSTKLLIEEEVPGDTIRLLYLDGKLLDAVQRNSPVLIGDGTRTVAQLVQILNRRRLEAGYKLAQVTLKYDMETKRTLARQGLSWRSVPAKDQRVTLKRVANDNMADENLSVADQVCESVVAAGRRAAELMRGRLVGVDVITPDPRRPLHETGGKIIEINTTPGLHYHYFKQGGPCRVAVPILKACLDQAHAYCKSTN